MLNAFILLLLIQLANDVEVQPGPGPAQWANRPRICQWNVQRLTDSKLEEIRLFLTRPGNEHDRSDILILSETFCTQKVPDSFYNTDGYQLHQMDRTEKSGGGKLVYVNNLLQTKRREELEAEDLEILWLVACPYKSSRSLFIGGVYRPPSFRVADDKRLGKNIGNVQLLNKETILLGDINIDFLCTMKFQKHPFIKTMQNLNVSQLAMEITRPLSKTCLDHIWSSHPERLINVRVLSTGMSDYVPTIVTRKYKGLHQNKPEHTTITYRDIKNLNKEQFIAALKEAPWDPAFIFDDPDDVVDAWYDIFQGVVDRFLPLKDKRVKRKFQPTWFNNHIVDGFKEHDKLLTKAKKCGSDHDWLNYRRAKNHVTNLIKQSKSTLRPNSQKTSIIRGNCGI